MRTKLILSLILMFMISIVSSADNYLLEDYPAPFIQNGKLNALLVIGSMAKPIDNIAVTGIAMSLQREMTEKVAVNAVVFDRDVKNISAQNLIIVGGPCVNTVAAELLGNKPDCTKDSRTEWET